MIDVKKPSYITGNKYFVKQTNQAIIDYNNSTCEATRSKIFRDHIHYAFYKLAENQINGLKAYYINPDIEESKHEVILYLLEKIEQYDINIGPAFSWFNVIARNYVIAKNKEAWKLISTYSSNVDVEDEQFNNKLGLVEIKNVFNEREDCEQSRREFFASKFQYEVNRLFTKPKENKIANAVAHILSRWESIDIFNKKAIYVMVKEMTDMKTQQITKVVNKIYDIYSKAYKNWLNMVDDNIKL